MASLRPALVHRLVLIDAAGLHFHEALSAVIIRKELREKLIQIGAKMVAHAKHVTFQLAEVAVSRQLFVRLLERSSQLRPACDSG
jgi:hypothetical protein